ncbi:MAG: carboxypeptidase-like regulatory domain-containing protein [Paludibacteraceae bacterium]|nr:carboxypeptidase-like regulatory domain-containing protein [Paludibacteraceae bacterium]
MPLLLGIILSQLAFAKVYSGRIVDDKGEGLMYATVYLKEQPVIGTATNMDGYFSLECDSVADSSILVLSCIGFETQYIALRQFEPAETVVRLHEQPIILTPTIVDAKKTPKSNRKRKASILHEVYARLQEESPKQPVRYRIVSDVKMEAEKVSWGMEQMLATIIQIPSEDITRADSIQFVGEYCKRYCDPLVRQHADKLLVGEADGDRKRLAQSIDSGTIVHRKLWSMSQIDKAAFLDLSDELARWNMTKQDEQHVLLTYSRTKNYLGIVKIISSQNLLVDHSASLQTFTQDMQVKVFLPFSIKVKDSDLEWLNLLNMDEEHIEKFRLKKANVNIHFETRYTHQDGLLIPMEKTMHVTALLEDNKHNQLPCELWGIQHITDVQTQGIRPLRSYRKSKTVPRVLVPIY